MKISNISDFSIKDYRKIDTLQIKVLYENDRHDGPLSGLCLLGGDEYYFSWTEQMDEINDKIVKNFFLIKMTDAQQKKEKIDHEKFVTALKAGELDSWYDYYNTIIPEIITSAQVVGWFTEEEGDILKFNQ